MPATSSDEELLLRQTVRAFARDQGLEAAADRDRFDRFPAGPVKAATQLGLLGLADASNAMGATAITLAVDELAQVDANLACAVLAHNACLAAAFAAGNVPNLTTRLANGELGSWLATEEPTGSDTAHPGTTATPDAKEAGAYRISGQKVWGINAAAADHFLVTATVAGQGLGVFWVPATSEGVTYGANEPILGLRAAGIRTIYLSDVLVPLGYVVGTPGQSQPVTETARRWFQLGAAAAMCGCVAGALEAASRFAETRIQFNAPIGSYQAVSDGLGTIDINLAAARALLAQAAAQAGQPDGALWAARAKAFANEMAIPMTRQAIRVQGGTGFMREGGTERFARDVRALQFVGETTQMQRDIIKRHLLSVPYPPEP